MYCANCGKQLPDDAKHCPKCATPQRVGVGAAETEPRWETCEIHLGLAKKGLFSDTLVYLAEAVGPQGTYVAAHSERFKDKRSSVPSHSGVRQTVAACNDLVDKLVRDGWDPLPRGEYWYSYRFRRRAT